MVTHSVFFSVLLISVSVLIFQVNINVWLLSITSLPKKILNITQKFRVSISTIEVSLSRDMTKPTKWHVHPAKTQIRFFAVCLKKACVLSYPLSASNNWSDWADAQADLSLRWAHTHFFGFVMSRPTFILTHLCLPFHKRDIGNQCRPRSDNTKWGVWSRSHCLHTGISIKKKTHMTPLKWWMDWSNI